MTINIDGSKGIRQNTTEVTKIPVGTTAQRPANPEAGMIRFNTDVGFVEWYDDVGDLWLPTSTFPSVVASGGTVTDIEQDGELFRVHTFTSSGTFDVARGGDEVEYLVIAAGGNSGNEDSGGNSGGGGAGGYRCSVSGEDSGGGASAEPPLILSSGSYSVLVGQPSPFGTGNGGNSQFHTITSIGGGDGGMSNDDTGFVGGSGGGGGFAAAGGAGTVGQGFSGGAGNTNTSDVSCGGGGGAGAAAGRPNGAPGLSSSIDGTPTFRGGGGGGSRHTSGQISSGGIGGGGDGGQDGAPNTGGGGGGLRGSTNGQGGSGIVIVRYKIG